MAKSVEILRHCRKTRWHYDRPFRANTVRPYTYPPTLDRHRRGRGHSASPKSVEILRHAAKLAAPTTSRIAADDDKRTTYRLPCGLTNLRNPYFLAKCGKMSNKNPEKMPYIRRRGLLFVPQNDTISLRDKLNNPNREASIFTSVKMLAYLCLLSMGSRK